jgi:5-methylcytosine-specific restriction endonuclease McrA
MSSHTRRFCVIRPLRSRGIGGRRDLSPELLLEQVERQKFAAAQRPRKAFASGNTRHIPATVKRAVWRRDGGQCGFVSDNGTRCSERAFLERRAPHRCLREHPSRLGVV